MAIGNLIEYKGFKGVYNTSDRGRIPKDYLEICQNVDIDDEFMLHRRKGYEAVYTGTKIHSLWANRDGTICLFCEGNALKRLRPDFGSDVLLTGITEEPMQFVEYGRKIYFSNKHIVGMIEEDGVPRPFPTPNQNFKKRMVGGHLIEVYNNRLYAAQNDKVFYSDATVLTQMDTRKNFLQFEGYIKMLKAVEDGLYVGAGHTVWFLAGDDPLSPGFVWKKVSESGVIEGSAIKLDGEVTEETLVTAIIWASEDGIYMGFPGGMVREVTKGSFVIPNAERGCSVYTHHNGYGQFLMTYEMKEYTGGGELSLALAKPDITLKGG